MGAKNAYLLKLNNQETILVKRMHHRGPLVLSFT